MQERRGQTVAKLPADVYEQLANLPSPEELEKTSYELFHKVRAIFDYHGVVYDPEKNSYRVKLPERIREKIAERKSDGPIRDIIGVRFVVRTTDRYRLKGMITSAFPLTPEVFPGGQPSVRDYADETVRDYIRKNFNPNISSKHSSLNINVVIPSQFEFSHIAEIQILSPEEYLTYHETRESYVTGRKNG